MSIIHNWSMLIVVSAPSGGGKTTLCDRLLAKHSDITRAITCTTRAPREGECHGVDYFFLERKAFETKIKAGEFLEYATVYGNLYGTLKSEVLNKLHSGKHVLLNIDVQGAAAIRKAAKSDDELSRSLVSVFLTPATVDDLDRRLRKRGSESAETLNRRLEEAKLELLCWDQFDYLIISTTKEADLRRMEAILEAESMRQSRVVPPVF